MKEFSRKELILFLAVAFGLPYGMGVPLAFCQRTGLPVDVFPNAQMFYPAAGAMLALLLTRREDVRLPRLFYIFYLVVTAGMAVCCVGQAAAPQALDWVVLINFIIIGASVAAWILLLATKKEKREAYGLRWHGGLAKPFAMVLLFLALYAVRVFAAAALAGQLGEYLPYWQTGDPYVLLLVLIPNFALVFLPFFGEEYGWRYYLQPRLQKRFGLRGGLLVLGAVWGLWHLPLNFFFYSPETSLQSVSAQIITCVTLGVFFAFAYAKTNNIWVPVMLHYLNNNLIVVFSGTAQISNQVYTWRDILLVLVLNGVLYLPFLASKEFGAVGRRKAE